MDPRRYGVRPTGSYWGDKGDQIDVLSGNLNYTLPLVTAQSRGGHKFTFNLNYNSQMWRQDTAGTWLLGEDIGYGLGWKLQAGSLTQYSTGIWGQVDHYVFTDSTGAEYKLYQNGSTGLWTSTESIYATYDSNANILHFNDGSFWIMGCISGGEEPDLGTLYPTQMEDSNGNYLTISYNQGAGTGWPNSSSRINQIVDVRAPYGSPTYQFNYNPNTNELTGINSSLNGQQTTLYTFNTAIQNLTSPTPSGANYGNTNVLTSVMGAPGYTTQFTYDTGSELTQVTFPTGGHFRYSYKTWNYTGAVTGQSRYIREVGTRYLSMNSDGSNEYAYPIGRSSDPNDGSLGLHYWCTLADPSGIGFKVWFFNASSGTPVWELGLTNNYQDRVSTSNSFAPRQYYYTWAQDPGSNAYIATRQTLWDGGQGYQQNSYETQTLDGNGNMLTRNIYDYTNSATPIRKYTYTYVTDGNYTSRYIRNKLATAIVTDGFGNNAVTLVHNQYDGDGGFPYGFGNGAGVSPPTNYGSLTMHDSNYSSSFPYRGNLTLQTTPSGVTGTVFDFVGNPWLTQGPHQPAAGVSTALSSNYTQPSAITANNTSASTVSLSYDALFLPTNFTGPNGATASATNDAFGRVTRSTSTDGAVTNYTYSSGSLPVTQLAVTGIQGQSGLTNATWTQTTLDGLGRAIKVQSGPGQTPGSAVTETDTTYGPCACSPTGKMTGASQPYQPGSASYWTNYTYDAIGRTVRVVSPDGASATTYVYQGNTTTVTDPAGKWKTTVTDAQGNNTQVTEPDPTGSTSGYQTYYTYDVMEHLTQVSMPRGSITQTRTFNYSPTTHLLTNETHPETGTTTYTYTPDSFTYDLLTSKTDAKGQVTKYTYDSYYRVTAINRYTSQANFNSGTDDPCQRVNNVYDAYSSSTFNSAYSWGHLAASTTGDPSCVINSAGATQQFSELYSYSYTGAGHVAQKRLQLYQATAGNVSGGTATWWDVGYTYNVFGQAVSVTYPNSGGSGAQTYTTGFDSMQRPANLTDSRGLSPVLGVIYNAANQPIQTQFQVAGTSTAFWENRGYNALNQLTTLNNFNLSPSVVSNGALNVTYNYSASQNNGQISSMTDNVLGQTVSYGYDAVKRLTSAGGAGGASPWSQTYSYDGFGNLTAKSGSGAVFNNAVDQTTNRLAGTNICYDPDGNLVSDANGGGCGNPNYGYDMGNRLVSAKVSGGTETYAYDAGNKRISKFGAGGNQTIYIYGAMGEKLAVVAAYGTAGGNGMSTLGSTNNVYFAGRLIKESTDVNNAYDNNFVAVDRLGSVRAASQNYTAFQVSTTASYLPFGEELSATTNDLVKFGTYTRDASTGLDYADQRFYTSQFGRFMSADRFKRAAKANDSGSWNKYSYTRNDPVNRVDPSGTDDCDPNYCVTVTDTPDPGGGGGGPQKGNPKNQGNDPASNYVECKPGGNPTTEKKLNFIWNNYAEAAAEAATVQSGVGKPIDTGALTTLFLQWSANESGYGVNPANAAENNFFGIQNPTGAAGLYGGTTVVCNANGNPIPTNTTNACFGAGVSWGQELGIALGIASSKTGVTYLTALEAALANGANTTQALQAIANNGWNGSPTYASSITGGIQIQTQINCLQKNGYI